MRVALISSGRIQLPPKSGGAVEEYIYQLSKRLERYGCEAIAIDFTFDYREGGIHRINGAHVLKILIPNISRNAPRNEIIQELMFGRRVRQILDTYDFDIIHLVTLWSSIPLVFKRNLNYKMKFIYTCHNGIWIKETLFPRQKIVLNLERYIMNRADKIIALNHTFKQVLIQRARIDNNKVIVVPNGVDTEFFNPNIKTSEQLVKLYNLAGKRVILYVGRIIPEKGIHILLKAFHRLIAYYNVRDVTLIIVGPLSTSYTHKKISKYSKELFVLAEKLKLRNNVIFTGPHEKNILKEFYVLANMLVLPSLAEAFPLVVLEAMACSCPIIVSDIPVLKEIVRNRYNGLTFIRSDYLDLAEKMYILLTDKTLRRKIKENARKTAEIYDWDIIALNLKKVYEECMTQY